MCDAPARVAAPASSTANAHKRGASAYSTRLGSNGGAARTATRAATAGLADRGRPTSKLPTPRTAGVHCPPQTPNPPTHFRLAAPPPQHPSTMATAAMPSTTRITVAVRVRPLNRRETERGAGAVLAVKDSTRVTISRQVPTSSSVTTFAATETRTRGFTFDHVFDSSGDPSGDGHATQSTVWDTVGAPLLDGSMAGFNVSLFAYGQTGACLCLSCTAAVPRRRRSADALSPPPPQVPGRPTPWSGRTRSRGSSRACAERCSIASRSKTKPPRPTRAVPPSRWKCPCWRFTTSGSATSWCRRGGSSRAGSKSATPPRPERACGPAARAGAPSFARRPLTRIPAQQLRRRAQGGARVDDRAAHQHHGARYARAHFCGNEHERDLEPRPHHRPAPSHPEPRRRKRGCRAEKNFKDKPH